MIAVIAIAAYLVGFGAMFAVVDKLRWSADEMSVAMMFWPVFAPVMLGVAITRRLTAPKRGSKAVRRG